MALSDIFPLSKFVVIFTIIAIIVALIQRFSTPQKDAREPPFLTSKIPILGHIVHLIREGGDYYGRLEQRYRLGLYTLPIFTGRMYIAATPEWANAVHRAHKTLHFNTLIAQAMRNLFLLDDAAMNLINDNLNGENGNREGIMFEIHDMMLATLAPGRDLDALNKSILNQIAPDVNQLAIGTEPTQIKLWEWLRHHFSVASVTAIWGPRSPFTRHPQLEPEFWEFEANAMPLTMMPFPQVFARKGYRARQKIFQAFEEYMEDECYSDPETSQLIKNRAKINMGKFGMSKKMHAWGDASLLFGAILNTIPAAFWLISRIYEDPKLLEEIREEINQCITTPADASADFKKRCIVNATLLRSSCPLFSSAMRETLRMTGSVNSNRFVAEDTTLTNTSTGETYLLREGSVIQIASSVIHFQDLWGPDAFAFNPRRFLPTGDKAKVETTPGRPQDPAAPFRDSNGKPHSGAFRSFGGGNNICPGRYFAQTEVLALASLFIAAFDIESVDGSPYRMPPYENFKLMLGVLKPARDVEVNIRRRAGFENVEFEFEI